MTKNESLFRGIVAGVFAVVCFTFFQWFYENHLFLKEQMRVFLYTTDYFISFWDEPAWLSCYVGNFLTQFYYIKGVGPLIVTLTLLLLWYVSVLVLRKFGGGNMVAVYAMFPVALEWGLMCRLTYNISTTLSFVFVLALFLMYIKIKGKRLSIILAFVFLPVIYGMVGSRLFIFSLLIIFYEGVKNRKRWWFWLLLLVASYLYPYFVRHFYSLTIEDAYKYSYVDGFSVYFPAVLFVLEVFVLQVRSIRRIRLNKQILAISVFILFISFGTVIWNTNLKREKVLALDHAVYLEDWDRVIALSDRLESPGLLASYYRNIALATRDQLPEKLLDYNPSGSEVLFLPVDLRSPLFPLFISNEVYYRIGDMDMARRQVIQAIIMTPKQRSGRLMKRLAEIDLQRGDTTEALKYLTILDATVLYRQWAVNQKELLVNGESSGDNHLPRKKDWVNSSGYMEAVSDYPDHLSEFVGKYPENKMALDYLLCAYLLDKKLNAFKETYEMYYKGRFTPVPRLYAEALFLEWYLFSTVEEFAAGYPDSEGMRLAYDKFRQAKTGDETREELHEQYSSHYWYYFDFGGKCF